MIAVCPKCDTGMFLLQFRDVRVDYCHKCRGLWLDKGELEMILDQTGGDPGAPFLSFQLQDGVVRKGVKHLCPRCDRLLREITVPGNGPDSGVVLGKCASCGGLWFDDRMLEQVLGLFPADANTAATIEFLRDALGMNLRKSSES